MSLDGPDRRRHEREPLLRPCKLLHSPSLRYVAGRTENISVGGALLVVDGRRPIEPGDEVEVAIAISGEGILPGELMTPARVVRREPRRGGLAALGVEFLSGETLAVAA